MIKKSYNIVYLSKKLIKIGVRKGDGMKFCLHKYFSVYDVIDGRNTLVFRKCFKCGKVKKVK